MSGYPSADQRSLNNVIQGDTPVGGTYESFAKSKQFLQGLWLQGEGLADIVLVDHRRKLGSPGRRKGYKTIKAMLPARDSTY